MRSKKIPKGRKMSGGAGLGMKPGFGKKEERPRGGEAMMAKPKMRRRKGMM